MNAFKPTKKQRENLARLADYLDALPDDYDRFGMNNFYLDKHEDTVELLKAKSGYEVPCGSCACAIGHGPAAGIRRHSSDGNCWDAYSRRVFGGDYMEYDSAGEFMFGPFNPDCPKQAATRIREVLEGRFS